MCGIIGYIGMRGATPLLLEGLKRMEYRGYDSAGVAVMNGTGVDSFGPALANPGPAWHEIAAADFNGDGKADILWQNDNGTPAVWLMDGTGVTAFGPQMLDPGSAWHII